MAKRWVTARLPQQVREMRMGTAGEQAPPPMQLTYSVLVL